METKVTHQGAPVINYASVLYQNEDCIVIELDLHSKYCDLVATGGHKIMLQAGAASLKLNPEVDRDQVTMVEFAMPEGKWTYTCGSASRYSVTTCWLRDWSSQLQHSLMKEPSDDL